MSVLNPRLKGSSGASRGPWPVGEIPDRVVVALGREIVGWRAMGNKDHGTGFGDVFGDTFAEAISGEHLSSPLGLIDVADNGTGWSLKTIKMKDIRRAGVDRFISGRISPDYSLGITDPRKNPEATGQAVLVVWNQRLNASLDQVNELRLACLVRDQKLRDFCLFEQPLTQFPTGDYTWQYETRSRNANENLQGYEKATGEHRFTWQPHGSQFTVKRPRPGSARYFRIVKNVPVATKESVLKWIGFCENWIEFG